MTKAQDTDPTRVWVFFYGTFMSTRVLRGYGTECERTTPARLRGYRLTISPRANLTADTSSTAYGGLAFVTQSEIDSLYEGLVDEFSLLYKPRRLVVETLDGKDVEALCYLCDDKRPVPPDPKYVEEMVKCCEELGLPGEYIASVTAFAD